MYVRTAQTFQLPTSAPLDLDTPACMGMVELILADRQTDNNLTTFSHLKSWSGKQTVWVVDEYIQKPNKIA